MFIGYNKKSYKITMGEYDMEKNGQKKKEHKIIANDIFKSKTIEERHENIIKILIKYINKDE